MAEQDKKTLALIEAVKKQKKEIAVAERTSRETNCLFRESPGAQPINLNVESDIGKLVQIAAFLHLKEDAYSFVSAEYFASDDVPKFKWDGYTFEEWMSDIKGRIAKLQINSKKKKLESLESRLSSIISPELRAQMELEAIEKELGLE